MRNNIFTTFFVMSLFLTGCAEHTMRVLPEVEQISVNVASIAAKIEYSENREYLPNIFKEDNLSNTTVSYSYSVKYINGSTDWDGANLFNPLLVVGFPLSEEAVIVEGELILTSSEDTKTFTASCVAKKTRSLYQNSGSSGPRRECLLAIRDNISRQVIKFKLGDKR